MKSNWGEQLASNVQSQNSQLREEMLKQKEASSAAKLELGEKQLQLNTIKQQHEDAVKDLVKKDREQATELLDLKKKISESEFAQEH